MAAHFDIKAAFNKKAAQVDPARKPISGWDSFSGFIADLFESDKKPQANHGYKDKFGNPLFGGPTLSAVDNNYFGIVPKKIVPEKHREALSYVESAYWGAMTVGGGATNLVKSVAGKVNAVGKGLAKANAARQAVHTTISDNIKLKRMGHKTMNNKRTMKRRYKNIKSESRFLNGNRFDKNSRSLFTQRMKHTTYDKFGKNNPNIEDLLKGAVAPGSSTIRKKLSKHSLGTTYKSKSALNAIADDALKAAHSIYASTRRQVEQNASRGMEQSEATNTTKTGRKSTWRQFYGDSDESDDDDKRKRSRFDNRL